MKMSILVPWTRPLRPGWGRRGVDLFSPPVTGAMVARTSLISPAQPACHHRLFDMPAARSVGDRLRSRGHVGLDVTQEADVVDVPLGRLAAALPGSNPITSVPFGYTPGSRSVRLDARCRYPGGLVGVAPERVRGRGRPWPAACRSSCSAHHDVALLLARPRTAPRAHARCPQRRAGRRRRACLGPLPTGARSWGNRSLSRPPADYYGPRAGRDHYGDPDHDGHGSPTREAMATFVAH